MDDNPKVATQQSQAPPQVGGTSPNVLQQPPASDGNNKLMLWLIGGLVIIILAVSGIYFYLGSQQKAKPTPSPAPPPKVQENLERELDSLTIDDVDQEFSVIDKDIESL